MPLFHTLKTPRAGIWAITYNYILVVIGGVTMSEQDDNDDFEKNRIKWEFFKLHANQRLTLFRYYIGLLLALFVAYFYVYDHLKCCQGSLFLYICLILAGLSISIISAMFYYIDSRNVELIDNAKKALKEIDNLSNNNPRIAFQHKRIFGVVFLVTFSVGILLFFLGGFKLGLDYGSCQTPACQSNSSEEKPHIQPSTNPKSGQPDKYPPKVSTSNPASGPHTIMEAKPPN